MTGKLHSNQTVRRKGIDKRLPTKHKIKNKSRVVCFITDEVRQILHKQAMHNSIYFHEILEYHLNKGASLGNDFSHLTLRRKG